MNDDKNLVKVSDKSEINTNVEMPSHPKPNSSDAFYNLLIILLGISGQIGGKFLDLPFDIPLANLFTSTFEPPITRRRDAFLKVLAEKFEILCKEHSELKAVFDDPERLITLLTHALPIAVKNHREEKINSLANVVCNAYGSEHSNTSNEIKETTELIMLDLVDRLTLTHIYVINFIREPPFTNSREEIYAREDKFKEFYENNSNLVKYILNELETLGLIYEREKPSNDFTPKLMGKWITDPYTGEGRTQTDAEQYIEYQLNKKNTIKVYPSGILSEIYEKKLTEFCLKFLAYISNPEKTK